MTDFTQTASQIGMQVGEAQGRAEQLSRAAARKLDEARHDAAQALHTAASSVRTTAAGAADKLDASASYVADHDVRGLFAGCLRLIRRNPAGAFVAAAAIGFFAGSAVQRIVRACATKPVDA